MAHVIISLKGPGTECVTLITECFASAVSQDHVLHVLSVSRVLVDSDE